MQNYTHFCVMFIAESTFSEEIAAALPSQNVDHRSTTIELNRHISYQAKSVMSLLLHGIKLSIWAACPQTDDASLCASWSGV